MRLFRSLPAGVFQIGFDLVCGLVNNAVQRQEKCCDAPKDVSMDSRILSVAAEINRGLLAAVCVFASMLPGVPCCCASLACCELQGATRCSAVESRQESCCCQESNRPGDSESDCSCSKASANPGALFAGLCCCAERPAANAVVADDHRDAQKRDRNDWFAELSPFVNPPASLMLDDVQSGPQCCRDPVAHNLRQAILCVWRN